MKNTLKVSMALYGLISLFVPVIFFLISVILFILGKQDLYHLFSTSISFIFNYYFTGHFHNIESWRLHLFCFFCLYLLLYILTEWDTTGF